MSHHRERARELLQRMNLAEKAAQLCAVWLVIEEDGSFSFRDVQNDFIPASLGDPVATLRNGIGAITKGFKRLSLQPRERARVSFVLPTDLLSYSTDISTRVLEPGDFELMIGRSSEDIVFREVVSVCGEVRTLPKLWRMVSQVRVEKV